VAGYIVVHDFVVLPSLRRQAYQLFIHRLRKAKRFSTGFYPMICNRVIISLASLLSCCAVAACASSTTQVVAPNVSQQPAARPIQNASIPIVTKGAESGKKQILGSASSTLPDCTMDGYPIVTVTGKPSNGQVVIEKDLAYPSFPKDNVRSVCNAQKVPGVSFYYTSNPGFVGTDNTVLDLLFPDGSIRKYNFSISVRSTS
jgi:hypothetical protein